MVSSTDSGATYTGSSLGSSSVILAVHSLLQVLASVYKMEMMIVLHLGHHVD